MPLDPQVNARDGYLLLSTAARLVQRRLDSLAAKLDIPGDAGWPIIGRIAAVRPASSTNLAATCRNVVSVPVPMLTPDPS